MRAAFLLDNFLEKTPLLNHAISPRPPLPILSGILIEAEKGRLKISATDLELGVLAVVPANIEEEGRVVLPAKPFLEILSTLPGEKITLSASNGSAEVLGKTARARFVTMDAAEFPKLFEEKGESAITLRGEDLEKNFGRVVFAASIDSGRPAFSAVMLKKDGENMLVVATDSHRLSLNKIGGAKGKPVDIKKPILVSAKTIRALLSQKSEGDVVVSLFEKTGQIMFTLGDTLLVGRLIDAEFPDFEKILPETSSTKAEFDRQDLLRAIKAASVFARDNANIVKLSVGKDKLTVSAKSQSLGEDSVDVPAKTTGEENEIAFNSRYLNDVLQSLTEDQMVFEMQGPLNPGVFKVSQNKNFIHLIMPIRIKDEDLG